MLSWIWRNILRILIIVLVAVVVGYLAHKYQWFAKVADWFAKRGDKPRRRVARKAATIKVETSV